MEGLIKALVLDSITAEEQLELNMIANGQLDGDPKEMTDNFFKRKYYQYDKELRKASLKRVIERRLDSYYMDKLLNSNDLEELLPVFKEIREDEEKKDIIKQSKYCFITYSPPPSSPLDVFEFIRLVDKVAKFSYIKKYMYVVEQRFDGVPNEKYKRPGDGMHIHLLIDKGEYRQSHLKRDNDRVFKNHVMNIDIKLIRESDLFKVSKYMIGEKKDPSKQVKQEQDKVYRTMFDLRDYYGDNTWTAAGGEVH